MLALLWMYHYWFCSNFPALDYFKKEKLTTPCYSILVREPFLLLPFPLTVYCSFALLRIYIKQFHNYNNLFFKENMLKLSHEDISNRIVLLITLSLDKSLKTVKVLNIQKYIIFSSVQSRVGMDRTLNPE